MSIEMLFKILGLGAVGVAGLALYFWDRAFKALTTYAAQPAHATTEQGLKVLAAQLLHYQKLVFGALFASVAVQLLAPVIGRYVEGVAQRHPIVFSITPADVMDGSMNPAITFNGTDLTPDEPKGRRFSFMVERESNVDVNVLHLRDHVQQLRSQIALRAAQPDTNAKVPELAGVVDTR